MEDLVKLLDKNLQVSTYERIDDEIFIYTEPITTNAICTYYKHKAFAETFEFLSFNIKTKRLEEYIMNIFKNKSFLVAKKILKKTVVKVENQYLQSTRKILMDKLSIRKICIDDFALKKREKYATVMIDIGNIKVVDILQDI